MATTSDTTPLLADSEPLEAGEYQLPQDGTLTNPVQRKPTDYRRTILLTHLAAALSIVAFIFDLTVICIDFASPGGFYLFWSLRERLQILFALSIVTAVTAFLNLSRLRHTRQPLWLWLNLIIDAVIGVYTVCTAPDALVLNFDQTPDSWLPDSRAAQTAQAVIVLLGIGLVAGLAAGLAHLVLFPVRCYASFASQSWQTPQNWRIPGGEFKIEFSIKFLRQDDGGDSSRGAVV